ncbi:hypothetical protein TcasGA2_TC014141 [Tribolium castaneum]|uniref:Uncharacterized protein n=1 Tax=Tribolium castaneum TaxID=7070 RepID=A0A139WI39_TRICA|nr:hypothetical protein TcasGA2_TC014141 [Tribolium castaneum]
MSKISANSTGDKQSVHTQCGDALTVDEENIVVMLKSYSPVRELHTCEEAANEIQMDTSLSTEDKDLSGDQTDNLEADKKRSIKKYRTAVILLLEAIVNIKELPISFGVFNIVDGLSK